MLSLLTNFNLHLYLDTHTHKNALPLDEMHIVSRGEAEQFGAPSSNAIYQMVNYENG